MNKLDVSSSNRPLHAVVPMKGLSKCKSRLSNFISIHQRGDLALAMLCDVLKVLVEHPVISKITVITEKPFQSAPEIIDIVEFIYERELDTRDRSLNSILSAGVDSVCQNYKDDILILHGDLPLLTGQDITATVNRLNEDNDIVLGADRRNKGTNLFAFRSGLRPLFQFGLASLKAHMRWADENELRAFCLRSQGIGFDLDTEMDLRELLEISDSGLLGDFTAKLISKIRITNF